jgi:hypothetical protein
MADALVRVAAGVAIVVALYAMADVGVRASARSLALRVPTRRDRSQRELDSMVAMTLWTLALGVTCAVSSQCYR